MSGHKRTTVSISELEYRRLHDAEMKSRFMERHLPDLFNDPREENQTGFQNVLRDVENRQNTFLSLASGLKDEIKTVEWATSQALVEKTAEITRRGELAQTRMEENLRHEMGKLSRDLQAEITSQTQACLSGIDQVHRRFASLEEEHRRKQEMALAWAQSAAVMDRFILDSYPPDMLDSDQIDQLESELQQVFVNLEQDIPEAAIAAAQQLYNRYSRMRVELEAHAIQAAVHLQETRQTLDELLAQLGGVQVVPALDMNGHTMDAEVDVDFWTGGGLQNLVEEVRAVRGELDDRAGIEPDLRRRLLEADIPGWQATANELVFQARLAVLNSQIRINIAELVVRALQEQGFQLRGGNYLNGDMRDGFEAFVQSLDGSEVLIRVNPVEQQEGRADVHLFSLDRERRSQQELAQRTREVCRSLQRHGLSVGNPPARGNTPPAERPPVFETLVFEEEAYVER